TNVHGGNHTLAFRGREPNTRLDRLYITSEPEDSPDDATGSVALSLSPSKVTGGHPAQGIITLLSAVPSGGTVISLFSGNTAVATVPATVTIGAYATAATFPVLTQPVAESTSVLIGAVYGMTAVTTRLTISPPQLPADGNQFYVASFGSNS